MKRIKTLIIGAGNCASALVQGVGLHKENLDSPAATPGLNFEKMRGLSVEDIEFVGALDVDEAKVGHYLGNVAMSFPNNAQVFFPQGNLLRSLNGVRVSCGAVMDGMDGLPDRPVCSEARWGKGDGVTKLFAEADVAVNFLPVGSEEATRYYADQAANNDCAFVNCIPVFLASDPEGYWQKLFADKNVPLIGDDIKSQVGATIVHRVLARLCEERGIKIKQMYQLNFGGNSDFRNMLDRTRLSSKKQSKTQSVLSQVKKFKTGEDEKGVMRNIHVGPSDWVPWLRDQKIAHIRIEGEGWGGTPLNLEVKLEVQDSPNSAGIVVDAIRYAAAAKFNGEGGVLLRPSQYCMKSPKHQSEDDVSNEAMLADSTEKA